MLQGYQRPPFVYEDYFDAQGALIPYGERWNDLPPEDSYSETSHPQRFAPIHQVGEELVDWLCTHFKVRKFDDPGLAKRLRIPREHVVRSVRLLPEDARCAPMGFVFTTFPGLRFECGALYGTIVPPCGCDACDESVPEMLDELEGQIDAVVSGLFVEILNQAKGLISHSFNVAEVGFSTQTFGLDEISPARLAWAREIIPANGQWAPWPTR